MKLEFVRQPKKIPLEAKYDFDLVIRFTEYSKWPKINKFLLSLGFLWKEIIPIDHCHEPMCIWFKHRIIKDTLIDIKYN
jgi:hypothetical protein